MAEEKGQVEAGLKRPDKKLLKRPDAGSIAEQSATELNNLADIPAAATVEEKRQFTARYIQKITADPDPKNIKISRYPALSSLIPAGGRCLAPTARGKSSCNGAAGGSTFR